MNQNLQTQLNPNNNNGLEISKLAIASFLIAIISFVQLFGFEKAILAFILGIVALREIANTNKIGRGYAIFGIVLSLIFMIILVGYMIFSPKTLLP